MSKNFPPVIRPISQNEIRLPHYSVMMTPEYVSALAKKYVPIVIAYGFANRRRAMSRRGVPPWAELQITGFEHTLSYWNGRIIPNKKLGVSYLLIAGDEECSWFHSFLSWSTRPPKYVQRTDKMQLRIELLTAAMMIYEQSQKVR